MADALPGSNWSPFDINPNLPPERADIVIIGGGVIGWSIAYWLKKKERVRDGVKVIVVEKDPTVFFSARHSKHSIFFLQIMIYYVGLPFSI